MNEEFRQTPKVAKKFRLGPLGSLNQVTKGLAKTSSLRGAHQSGRSAA